MEPKSVRRARLEDAADRPIGDVTLTWSSGLPRMCKSAELNCEIWKLVALSLCECLLEAQHACQYLQECSLKKESSAHTRQ